MAQYSAVKLRTGMDRVDVYEWQNDSTGSSTFTCGTDTLNTAGVAVGGTREVSFCVNEITAAIATITFEGTLDPDGTEYLGLTDATSGSTYAVDLSTGEGHFEILQPVLLIRPSLTVNTSGTISIRMIVNR